MKCTQCGFENNTKSKFCGKCGALLDFETPARPAKKPRRKRRWIPLVCVLVVLALGAGGYAWFRVQGGEEVPSIEALWSSAKELVKPVIELVKPAAPAAEPAEATEEPAEAAAEPAEATAEPAAHKVKLPEIADYLGTWYMNGIATIDFDSVYFAASLMDEQITLEIKEDGTADILTSAYGGTAQGNASWKMEGGSLNLITDTGVIRLRLQKDGTMTYNEMNAVFGREYIEMEPYQPAAPVKADSAEAFAGAWAVAGEKIDDKCVPVFDYLYNDTLIAIEGTTVSSFNLITGAQVNAFEARFEDGALVYDAPEDSETNSFTVQLLEDGAIQLLQDGINTFYLVDAEQMESKAYQPANYIKAVSPTPFAGSWTPGWMGTGGNYLFPAYNITEEYVIDIDIESMTVSFNVTTPYYNGGLYSTRSKARFEDGALVYDGPAEDGSAGGEQADFVIWLLEDGTLWMDYSNAGWNPDLILEQLE